MHIPAIIAGMVREDPKVIPLPLSRTQMTELVRDIASDSSRWSINVAYSDKQDWRKLVNRRQVDLCLREGYVLDDRSRLDEHGYWRFRVARVCAGLDVVIEVAVSRDSRPRLYVVDIRGDEIRD
jgi:hypothetical protein